jgi:undecaprenyl phosphate-alpha-L-ara4FN deformylase
MPTYDEVLGRDGVTDDNYNDFMLSQLKPGKLNVLTIHAEAEGGKCLDMFEQYIIRAKEAGWQFTTLGELVKDAEKGEVPEGKVAQEAFPGREGWLGVQR